MINKIRELEKLARLLEPNEYQRGKWNAEVLDYANAFLNNLNASKAYIKATENSKEIYNFGIEEQGIELAPLLESTTKNIDGVGINPASSGHMGYIPGGGLYPSALGDFIAAVSNRYAGVFYAAPGAVRVENMLIRWMCRLMGYQDTAFGNLTSGGSVANLIALVTAREVHGIKARDFERCVIYLTQQSHHSIIKAIQISGLSEAQLRYITLDENLKLSSTHLEEAIIEDIKNGLIPFYINASFGTTNTGAIDPLKSIATIAEKYKLWFHVDAAYGGFFKLVGKLDSKFEGIKEADSITLDPHKTLFLPYGTGTVLIKNKAHLLKTYHCLADYMQDIVGREDEISPADVSVEQTKHFRGMRMWLPLKLFGVKPFRAALEEKLYLTKYFYNEIQKITGIEVGPEPELSVAIFRYVPKNEDANAFNKKLIEAIQNDGRIFLSSTNIHTVFWIRIAVVQFKTHLKEIALLLTIIKELLKPGVLR